ncbi:MAG: hypothetical protein Q8K07_12525 [Methylicorpusculum sp.]|uniref:hypothetical protein n=2 Tax=Methylicorpusculum sp. TaxID=2713644 RepID=UPI00272F2932|nr:hypothetical protein [Methylicorpusculum sp.]MDP2202839.1 hypothetical protein [Methylicorpusculum sp.]
MKRSLRTVFKSDVPVNSGCRPGMDCCGPEAMDGVGLSNTNSNSAFFKAMFALIVGVAPAGIAGVQKPWMALGFQILLTWIRLRGLTAPAIHAGMTVLIYFQLLTRTVPF